MPTTRGAELGLRARMREQRGLLVAIALAELIALLYTGTINPHAHVDGEVYQLGARTLVSGQSVYDDLPATEGGLHLPFIYPPFAALLFAPLAYVPKAAAIAAIMLVSHLALLTTLYVVLAAAPFTRANRDRILLGTAVALPLLTLTEPVVETLTYAQINLVLIALVAVDLLWRTGGARSLPYPRGALIGIAAGIKLTPLVFLLFPLLRKDVRTIAVSVLTFAATAALGFAVTFRDAATFWTREVWATSNVSFGPMFTGDASVYAGNQSLRSFLVQAHVPAPSAVLAVLLALLLVLTVLGMRGAMRRGDLPMAVMINAVFGLLASPISWSHHWSWAVPALVLLTGSAFAARNWALLLTTGVAAAIALIGPHWGVPQGDGLELEWNVLQHALGNSYVYLGVALLVYMAVRWWHDRSGAGLRSAEDAGSGPAEAPGSLRSAAHR
ncbi:glycosyltransferase 87 family protein [Salinifilum aidingensis]